MGNPFQDQLLKAGLVTKKQVKKANQEKTRKKKQQPKNAKVVDETKQKAQQTATDKTVRDRELNKQKELQARQKANSIEINQLIENNCLARDENCGIVYNFEHNKKIKRIHINADMQQQIAQGKLAIARIEGGYEVVPKNIAEKIQQRNEKRIVLCSQDQDSTNKDDPYADYQIPDDLQW
jgi:uncharacterized protein YaiL (DUF2058 family)